MTTDDFSSAEEVKAAKANLSLAAGRCLGRAERITNSTASTSTTLIPVLRLDDITCKGGRLLRIETAPLYLDTSVANDAARVTLTYTLDGSTPTIASTPLPGGFVQAVLANVALGETPTIVTTLTPPADGQLSLLVCVSRLTGSGSVVIQADGTSSRCQVAVYDASVDPGDTGVDL